MNIQEDWGDWKNSLSGNYQTECKKLSVIIEANRKTMEESGEVTIVSNDNESQTVWKVSFGVAVRLAKTLRALSGENEDLLSFNAPADFEDLIEKLLGFCYMSCRVARRVTKCEKVFSIL